MAEHEEKEFSEPYENMASLEEYYDDMDVDSVEGEDEEDLSGSATDASVPSLLSPQISCRWSDTL